MIPSIRPIKFIEFPSKNTSLTNTRNNNVTMINIGRSKNLVVRESAIGAMQALTQRIKNIFAILEPSTFPMAISGLPEILARTDTMSSGILVPIATIVRPMIASEIPNFLAMDTAPSTSTFHPNVSNTNQRIMEITEMRISIS